MYYKNEHSILAKYLDQSEQTEVQVSCLYFAGKVNDHISQLKMFYVVLMCFYQVVIGKCSLTACMFVK